MASTPRLKQSSMDAFLLPQPPPNPNHQHSAASAAADYERIRQENIRRNNNFFQKLGIAAPSTPNPNPTRRHPKGTKPSPATSVPLRRSSRKRGPPPAASVPLRRSTRKRGPLPGLPPSSEDDASDEAAEPSKPSDCNFVDSSVFQYVCDASVGHKDPSNILSSSAVPESPSSPILGFRIVGNPFRDPSLAKIYSMDVRFLKERRFLVAAGGHGGFISIYGGSDGSGGGEGIVREEDGFDGSSERETEGPLMSWKGSQSWVSGVMFVQDNPMLLVSSSNDGRIVVWDIKKQPALLSGSWSPPVVAESMGLHSGGIFSMDISNCSIATASKDSTVGISRLTSTGELVVERSVSGHHSGVIRGICFGEKDTLADCGADGRICVLDTRLSQPCALTIESHHSTGVNTVQWCKTNKSLLLSASKDPTLLLYDIRSTVEPLRRLRGHVESSSRTSYQIYRPSFVDSGRAIATPGQGSRKISMYSVDSGELVSQGVVGYDANLVMFTSDDDGAGHPTLWAAGRHIDQLSPYCHNLKSQVL